MADRRTPNAKRRSELEEARRLREQSKRRVERMQAGKDVSASSKMERIKADRLKAEAASRKKTAERKKRVAKAKSIQATRDIVTGAAGRRAAKQQQSRTLLRDKIASIIKEKRGAFHGR